MRVLLLLGMLYFMGISICRSDQAQADFSHKFELVSTSFGLSVAGIMGFDSDRQAQNYWWASPVMVTGLDVLYRIPELENPGQHDRAALELQFDLSGVVLSVVWRVIFPPTKER